MQEGSPNVYWKKNRQLTEGKQIMDAIGSTWRGIEPIERETIKRVTWRLLPLLMVGYLANYLDRVNVGMGALTMTKDLGFSNAMFGFGAGLFFVGYCLCELPSNLILNAVGARRWIARIMVSWGLIAGLTAFVWNDWSFYAIRFLLGVSEAGLFPGVILYLTWWYPSYYRTRMIAMFYSASIFSMIIGPPISGLLLQMDGALGLHGWQWMFLIEALPSIIMSMVIWQLLTDRPAEATWLSPEQRTWLTERLASERAQREAIRKFSLGETFCNWKIWVLALAAFAQNQASYGVLIFLPLIVKGLGVSSSWWIGVISALPYLFAFVAMNYWGWHSDRSGERIWHLIGGYLLCGAGLTACVIIGIGHPVLTMIALICAIVGSQSAGPIFWALPTALLTGAAAAGGIGLINSISNLGGFVGPWVFGLVKDATGSDNIALLCLALLPFLAIILFLVVGHDSRLERTPRSAGSR